MNKRQEGTRIAPRPSVDIRSKEPPTGININVIRVQPGDKILAKIDITASESAIKEMLKDIFPTAEVYPTKAIEEIIIIRG